MRSAPSDPLSYLPQGFRPAYGGFRCLACGRKVAADKGEAHMLWQHPELMSDVGCSNGCDARLTAVEAGTLIDGRPVCTPCVRDMLMTSAAPAAAEALRQRLAHDGRVECMDCTADAEIPGWDGSPRFCLACATERRDEAP